MTLAEINDRIRERLTDGRGPALDNCGCRYRAGGLGCAIGCLIPDEQYDPQIEGVGVVDTAIRSGKWIKGRTPVARAKLLARALNASGVPATKAAREALLEWQTRHDDSRNWRGATYVGLLDDPEV